MNTLTTNIDLAQMNLSTAVIIPVIVAIVQAIKMTGWAKADKFAPLVSIGVGIAIAFIAHGANYTYTNIILNGVLYGLSASGLYSGVRATQDARNADVVTNGDSAVSKTTTTTTTVKTDPDKK